jgi:hypothetical protein
MFFRFGSKSGDAVPPAQQALQDVHAQLQQQQQLWAEKLAQDPACFASLEQEVHLRFSQLADRLVASLLAGVAGQPALQDAAQKKSPRPSGPSGRPSNAAAASASSAA